MLFTLSNAELDAIAPIDESGSISVDTSTLAQVLTGRLEAVIEAVAINRVDYSADEKHPLTGVNRTVEGIAWQSGDAADHSHVWSFRADDLDLSITDEGEKRSPISEDPELIARAIMAIAGQYPESIVKEPSARVEVLLPSGTTRQVRVIVTSDARITRAEDVLEGVELIAYQAGRLGVAMVHPVEGGFALVRKLGMEEG